MGHSVDHSRTLDRLGTMRRLAGLTASGGLPSFQSSSGAFLLLCLEPFPFLPPVSDLDVEEEGTEAQGSSLSEAGLNNNSCLLNR